MADGTNALRVPPGAVPIVRATSLVGAAQLDTVPDGFLWVIQSLWITIVSGGTNGSAGITTPLLFDATIRNLLRCAVGTTGSARAFLPCCIMVDENTSINTVNSATGATLLFGFNGFQRAKTA